MSYETFGFLVVLFLAGVVGYGLCLTSSGVSVRRWRKAWVSFILAFSFLESPLRGQEQETTVPISTDRPSESAGPGVVPPWALQFEMGYKLSRAESQDVPIDTQEVPDLLLRFGLLETLEARLTMNGWSFQDARSGGEHGFNDVTLGAKWAFARVENGPLPQTAILAEVTLPVGDPGFTDDFVNPKVLMLFTNTLSERMSLTYNFGSSVTRLPSVKDDVAGERMVVDLPYTAMLSGHLGRRWGWFAELFGAIALNQRKDRHTFQLGVTTLLTDVVQLDVRGGVGLVDNVSIWLVGAGVGFRLLQ